MTNLKSLIGKLDETCRRALEGAAGLCLARTHYEVDVEHVLVKLLEGGSTDLHRIVNHFAINLSRLSKELTVVLDSFKTGNSRTPALSPRLPEIFADAWLVASVDLGAAKIRSGHVLIALLQHPEMAPLVTQQVKELLLVKPDALRDQFARIVAGSEEDQQVGAGAPAAAGVDAGATAGAASTKALDQFTVDLTERARQGAIDPVTGRDFEVRQLVDILMRRRQNNPILTGEAGVGKTAVVEGFALRVAEGDVPPPLKGVAVRSLDMGLLQAGAGIKGEFENRLKSVISEVKASTQPIILFIDEAHTMIGAGGQAGQNDAANLLKPALARGELRTIAATTWAEYKKYFEKDAALARRFQVVKVEEPTADQAVLMMRYLAPKLEKHHQVRILDEAVEAAVRLSDRYLSGRQLPDKAVSVLDTACARLAINQSAVPGALEDCRRRLAALDHEIAVLDREQATAADHDERLVTQREARAKVQEELTALEARWEQERTLIQRIRDIRTQLEALADGAAAAQAPAAAQALSAGAGAGAGQAVSGAAATTGAATAGAASSGSTDEGRDSLRKELDRMNAELDGVQGEHPLMQAVVNAQTVGDVISGWTGIPVGKMKGAEIATVLALKERLEQRVLGQAHGLEAIAERIRISRARLEDPRKPIGVFMLVGPSGVGKTETALALAETLYGGEQNLITINMSEYQEAHTVSSLKGSPPGYVGYGEGGVLTEAVRRKPYSVVLLDEVEKAHSDVLELFFQVFDKGMLEDGEGREIDFKNTVILLTSNVGTDVIMKLCLDEDTRPDAAGLTDAIRPELLKHFPPAFLGRLIVVPYYRISEAILRQIIQLQLGRIGSRIQANHRAEFTYDEAVVDAIKARCTEVDSGARNVEHILMRSLLPEISNEILARLASEAPITRVHVSAGDGKAFGYAIA